MYADNNGNGNSALIDNISVDVTGSDATILFPDSLVGDLDSDGVPDSSDNCVNTPNADQNDCDQNGIGDACEADMSDCNGNGISTIAIFKTAPPTTTTATVCPMSASAAAWS